MTARQHSFPAIAVPLVLIVVAALAIGKDIKAPGFVQSWSLDSKAFGLFAIALIALCGLALLSDVWAIRIDPEGVGRDRKPIARQIDNANTHASIAAVLPFAAYGKEISMWPYLTVIGFCGLVTLLRSMRADRQIKSQSE